jgi:hypothetical protein
MRTRPLFSLSISAALFVTVFAYAEEAPQTQSPGTQPAPTLSIFDKVTNRHLLTEFGPTANWVDANTTLEKACAAIIAQGGGSVVIPNGIDANFFPRSPLQDSKTKAGVVVEDYRRGIMHFSVLPEGHTSSTSGVGGSVIFERDISNDIDGQGGGYTVAIANRFKGGVNSINDIITRDTAKGTNAKFYVNSLRGICPGNYFYCDNAAGRDEGHIKSVGMDGNEPYFTADAKFDHVKGDRFYNKNWLGGLQISEVHNADDQSGSLTIDRKSYGSGDTFGIMVGLDYAGDIMTAGGDEGGNLVACEVRQDIDLFWGSVEKWDPITCKLVFNRKDAYNHLKIGTSRPIINMNPKKWIADGKVIFPQNGFLYKGIASAIVGNADVKWDDSLIGKYISINEPSEMIKGNQWNGSGPVGPHDVRRWFHITNLVKRADGLWNMGIETVWWGSHRGGQPRLFRQENYTTDDAKPRELSYIIADGSWAIDVRHALGTSLTYVGNTPEERTIVLAPFQQSATAFEPGDPICQPPGPTAWTPIAFRARYFGQLPTLMPGCAYEANNFGATTVGSAFAVDGTGPGQTIEQIEKNQNDGLMPWGSGLSVAAATSYAIYINGPVKYAAMMLNQQDGNRKAIQWLGKNGGANIFADVATGDFVIETNGNINLGTKSTIMQTGISATNLPSKNLRGINFPVAAKATELKVVFRVPEPDATYAVMSECSWITVKAVKNKTAAGFTVVFEKETPDTGGTLDWFLVR